MAGLYWASTSPRRPSHPNAPEFRKGPVPYTGVTHYCRWWKGQHMYIREHRLQGDSDHYKYTRGKRRINYLYDPWDDEPRQRRSRGWKEQGKRQRAWVKR